MLGLELCDRLVGLNLYQRIAYADARFGGGSGTDGWRTDRGRTYITLGAPQQKETYLGAANLFPIEIWFYSYSHPALPAFFYVMFYQRDGFGDMRYYSPFMDGPDKLVPGTEAINNRKSALKMIQDSVGPMVAHLTLSLIPNEPVDPSADRPSLQSDAMLATIKSLANNPFTKQDLDRRRNLIGSVTARLIVPGMAGVYQRFAPNHMGVYHVHRHAAPFHQAREHLDGGTRQSPRFRAFPCHQP